MFADKDRGPKIAVIAHNRRDRRDRKAKSQIQEPPMSGFLFRRRRMTKQEIMDAITGCAEKLGRTPSILEVMKMGQVSRRQMRAEFGSFTQTLRACNLEREISTCQKDPLEQLFVDWAGV